MQRAFKVNAGETRGQGTLNILGDLVNILVSGNDVDGGFCIMEDRTEPQGGPPLHRHNREHEWWYILEGLYRFEIDGRIVVAGPGASLFAARGTVHTFQNIGRTVGRMLVLCQPAGLDSFFEDLAAATAASDVPDPATIVSVFEKHGLDLVGPPLAARQPIEAAR